MDTAVEGDERRAGGTDVAAALIEGAARVIRGKRDFLELLAAALLAGGHVLLEDRPGLGKTTLAKTVAALIGAAPDAAGGLVFKRLQCTPDLLPYDVTGVDVFDPRTGSFRFAPGPVMANIVLADEINRATPKTQSALLEVMAENQVTVGQATYPLPAPFFVLATQNPVESEGTFPLPAAELDRFMMRLSIGYPDRETEIAILTDNPAGSFLPALRPVTGADTFIAAQKDCAAVFCHPSIKEAITDILRDTRSNAALSLGASPRAGLHLLAACRALARVRGRDFVTDEDLAALCPAVLAHRLKLKDARAAAADETARALVADIARRRLCP